MIDTLSVAATSMRGALHGDDRAFGGVSTDTRTIRDGELFLLDFDKAKIVPSLTPLKRAQSLMRLRRSMIKNDLSMALFEFVCEGYGVNALPEWIDKSWNVAGAASQARTSGEGGRPAPSDGGNGDA